MIYRPASKKSLSRKTLESGLLTGFIPNPVHNKFYNPVQERTSYIYPSPYIYSKASLLHNGWPPQHKLLLDKETKSAISEMRAELGARLVKLGKNSYRLKISNRGKVEARNIRLLFPDNDCNEYLSSHDVSEKFPYEILHPQHGIDIIAHISMRSKTKYRMLITWEDDYKKTNEEEYFVSI